MRILLFIIFVDFVGFGLLLPLLPFLAMEFGASVLEITLMISLHPALSVFFSPLLGRLSDRMGRKPVLAVSLALGAVAFLWFGLAPDLWHLFAARALLGVSAASATVAQAYIADITSREDRSAGMAKIGAAISLGFVAGPALGALLAPDEGEGFLLICSISAAAALLSSALCFFLKEERRGEQVLTVGDKEGARVVLKSPDMLSMIVMMFIVTYVFTQFIAILPIMMKVLFAWGVRETGIVIALIGIVYAVMQGFALGRLTRWLGEFKVLLLGTLIAGGSLMVLGDIGSQFWFVLVVLLACVGTAVLQPCLSSLMSLRVSARSQGMIMGVGNSAASLARVAGPPLSGLIFEIFGPEWPGRVAAIIAFFSIFLIMTIQRLSHAEQERRYQSLR